MNETFCLRNATVWSHHSKTEQTAQYEFPFGINTDNFPFSIFWTVFETNQRMLTIFDCLDSQISIKIVDHYLVTGVNASVINSQSNRLKVSASFNKHFCNVFDCKHSWSFLRANQKLMSSLSAILKTNRSVS